MKFLAVATVLCVLALVNGSAIGSVKNDKDTRQLISMLEKMLKKVSTEKKQETSSSIEQPDEVTNPFEALAAYLQENEADILDTPVYKVPEERLEGLLANVDGLMSTFIDDDMHSVVALRFIVAFFEHTIFEGTEKIWEIAGAISSRIEEFKDMNEVTMEKRQRVTRALNAKKDYAREMSLRALSADKETLTKEMFEKQEHKADLRDLDALDEFSGEDFSAYEYCQYSAIWDHVAGPAYTAAWSLRAIISEFDVGSGNLFYTLQYLAEDEGVLQASVRDAVYVFAYQFADILYSRPETIPSDDVWMEIVPVLVEIVEAMENFDGTAVPEVAELSEEKKAIFAQIYLAIGPLIQEAAKPVRSLVDALLSGDGDAVGDTIRDKMGRIFGRQLYILANLANIIREHLPYKAEALAAIDEAVKNGRGEDVLVAILTKVADAAMAEGERIENMIYFFGHLLDHVAQVVSADGVNPAGGRGRGDGDSDSASGGRGRGGNSDSTGRRNRKRFLKMFNNF